MSEEDEAGLASLFEGLDMKVPTDVVDVTTLTNLALVNMLADTRQALLEGGAMLVDLEQTFGSRTGTDEERALHSLRLALLTETRKRGLT